MSTALFWVDYAVLDLESLIGHNHVLPLLMIYPSIRVVSSSLRLLTSPYRRLSSLTSRHPSSCSVFEPSLGRLLQLSSYCIDLVRRRFSRVFAMNCLSSWTELPIYRESVYIIGDFNIRLDRPDDLHADQLRLLVACYGLVLHATRPTHQLDGTLDAVIKLDSSGRPDCVAVEDVDLSDHFLLHWEVSAIR
jgi:hypothetical protein